MLTVGTKKIEILDIHIKKEKNKVNKNIDHLPHNQLNILLTG